MNSTNELKELNKYVFLRGKIKRVKERKQLSMKSLNFKRKETAQLRYLEEKMGGKPKSRLNWDRIVYLLLLALLVFFILRYLFIHNFYITANGQVLFENIEISHTEDITIERFICEEGNDIKIGDTLFIYRTDDFFDESLEDGEEFTNKSNWAEREKYTLRKNIDLNNSQIRGDKELLKAYKSQLAQLRNEVILGTASEREINNLEYQISKLETAIKLTRSENSVLSKQLAELDANEEAVLNIEAEEETTQVSYSPFKAYVSPIDGYVARIFKQPYEVALKSQIIMKVHQADQVHIKGYFEQKDLKYVKEGDIVQIDFPDGKESEGVIEKFYSSTVLIPEEFQKKFEPAKRTIAVDIRPTEGSDLSLWKRYYKLSATLTKRTF